MEHWLEQYAETAFRRSGDTAHDLKTPLNVAVLNLELLRMRLRKLANEEEDDEKVVGYTRSIEIELRRMAKIFDSFFLYSVPPRGEAGPMSVPLGQVAGELARAASMDLNEIDGSVVGHPSRIRYGLRMFFEGAGKLLTSDRNCRASKQDGRYTLLISGRPDQPDFELTKVFKFYYTDALGHPELSLATARLIAETCGGELTAAEDAGLVTLQFSLPLGEE